MADLPLRLPLEMMQTRWASQLNPVLKNEMAVISFLKDVELVMGTNIINHRLGRLQQGWVITDIQGVASIFRNAPFNNLTLSLDSSAQVMVTIGVF